MNIIIGISGGIATYKICDLARLLSKSGHTVKVIMTENAKKFVSPITFSALTGNKTYDSIFNDDSNSMLHIDLARWADCIVIAPATANIIAKICNGIADDLLTVTCLATSRDKKIFIAPAMNKEMWDNPITQQNVTKLSKCGYHVLPTEFGDQACGDLGFGRMLEPEKIFEYIAPINKKNLSGINVIITAGPTIEKIDPVRYVSNFSSGKMGYALAEACRDYGAKVYLITGPVNIAPPKNCILYKVNTADEMLKTVEEICPSSQLFICAAAVADYKPKFHAEKIKKSNSDSFLTMEMEKTIDIISFISKKYPELFTVGFCAETNLLIENARKKLQEKKCNIIIANKINEKGYPFNSDTNEVSLVSKKKLINFPDKQKKQLAYDLLDIIIDEMVS